MRRTRRCPSVPRRAILLLAAASSIASTTSAQTATLNASSLVFRSTGTASGTNVTLNGNGYLGTYVTLALAGTVTFSVNASGTSDAGVAPRLGLVVADSKTQFNLTPTASSYSQSIQLPAGTHFVRLQYDNDAGSATRNARLNSLTVTGASVLNANTSTNALTASDTYIANFRKGAAQVALTGPGGVPLLAGQSVNASLQRHAFSFGTAVPGTNTSGVNNYLGATGTARQAQYQARLLQNFNAIVPENAGKWAYNEATRDAVTMGAVDAMLNYAQANNLRARMHNLIWGDNSNNGQQPAWVLNSNAAPNNGLLDKAYLGDAAARDELRAEITERIASYVGAGATTDRSKKYYELDVYNESFHTGSGAPAGQQANYWNVFGPTGVADVYRETIAAINASGATARVFVNEYNTLDDNAYANYYVQNIEAIRNAGVAAGYGDVVQGIGAQYYPSTGTHAATKVIANLQNLAVQGLPVALTEFGAQSSLSTATSATILGEMLRLTFGNADSTGFFMWGFHQESGTGATTLFAPQAALYTVNTADFNAWTLTDAGRVWQDQLGIADWDGNASNGWTTNVNAVVDANGRITFTGFFGDYALGGQPNALALAKGTTQYARQLTAPPTWAFWSPAASGNFATAGNWTNGLPGGAGWTAHFAPTTGARTVAINANVTLGQINFDGAAGSYALAGTGTITLDGAAGVVALNLVAGQHSIANAITSTDQLVVRSWNAGTLTLAGPLTSGGLRKSGNGTLRATSIVSNGIVLIDEGTLQTTGGTSIADGLQIASGARLDIADGVWVVRGAGSEAALRSLISSGRIVSSTASGNAQLALGIGVTSELAGPLAAIGNAAAIRLTYRGDGNLDGIVNFDDLLALAASYNGPGRWTTGDFTADGVVNFDDLLALASNYNRPSLTTAFDGGWAMAATVPEPAASFVLAVVAVAAIKRRR